MEEQYLALDEILSNCIVGCQTHQWPLLTNVLHLLVQTYQVDAKKMVLDKSVFDKIHTLLSSASFPKTIPRQEYHYEIYAYVFRILRASVAGNPENVKSVIGHKNLLNYILDWLKANVFQINDEHLHKVRITAIKCCLQFFANAVGTQSANGNDMRSVVWKSVECQVKRHLLSSSEHDIARVSSCIAYNCLLDEQIFDEILNDVDNLFRLVDALVDDLKTPKPSEWTLFTFHRVLQREIGIEELIKGFVHSRKMVLLDVIVEMCKQDCVEELETPRLAETSINVIFTMAKGDLVFLTEMKNIVRFEPYSLYTLEKLLDIIGEITANDKYEMPILDDVVFFSYNCTVLSNIHSTFKAKKPREMGRFGSPHVLKKPLVRIIANLLYNRPHLQNLANQTNTVPLILDLAHHDYDNPFIREYAILAIRNLLRNHKPNQEIVQNLSKKHSAAPLFQELVEWRVIPNPNAPFILPKKQ